MHIWYILSSSSLGISRPSLSVGSLSKQTNKIISYKNSVLIIIQWFHRHALIWFISILSSCHSSYNLNLCNINVRLRNLGRSTFFIFSRLGKRTGSADSGVLAEYLRLAPIHYKIQRIIQLEVSSDWVRQKSTIRRHLLGEEFTSATMGNLGKRDPPNLRSPWSPIK